MNFKTITSDIKKKLVPTGPVNDAYVPKDTYLSKGGSDRY